MLYDYGVHVHGLVQDCSNSIANALELLQSCTKPLMYISVSVSHTLIEIYVVRIRVRFNLILSRECNQ